MGLMILESAMLMVHIALKITATQHRSLQPSVLGLAATCDSLIEHGTGNEGPILAGQGTYSFEKRTRNLLKGHTEARA